MSTHENAASEIAKAFETVDAWSYDIFALADSTNGKPLIHLACHLFDRYGIIKKYKIDPDVLGNFLGRIEVGNNRYLNPFHNNTHVADVTQTMHFMLIGTGLIRRTTDLENFASFLAAIVHDFEHMGLTNNFQVMTKSERAMIYNDRSVNENCHVSSAFRILREDGCNILSNLSRSEYQELRTLVIDMVLATDISSHFQQIKEIRNILKVSNPTVSVSKALSMVLRCCDMSHPGKAWSLHHAWSERMLEESFNQGDKERRLGLPLSPGSDRINSLISASQIGYIDYFVEPAFVVMAQMIEVVFAPTEANDEGEKAGIPKPWVQCLAENKQKWKAMATEEARARRDCTSQLKSVLHCPPMDFRK